MAIAYNLIHHVQNSRTPWQIELWICSEDSCTKLLAWYNYSLSGLVTT